MRMRLLVGATFSIVWRNWFMAEERPTSAVASGVSCLSGYYVAPATKPAANAGAKPEGGADVDEGRIVAFSFLFNEFRPSLDVIMRLQDNLVGVLDEAYAPAK